MDENRLMYDVIHVNNEIHVFKNQQNQVMTYLITRI